VLVGGLVVAGGLLAQTKAPAKKAPASSAPPAPYPAALLRPAALVRQAPAEFEVKFVTTKGDFVVKVTRAWAPLGADRFYNLVQNRFYDGAAFFRVVKTPRPFVVQFGLSAYPVVSRVWAGARIKDDPVVQSNKRGFVTYAMAGPNTRTTQVYVNLGDNSRLDAMGFAPFGEVTQGMEVIDELYGGYGDGPGAPDQGLIQEQGSAYLQREFPLLDSIKTARVVVSPARTPSGKSPPTKQP
jgi:peptidyl-prolyl cis-trans isomerase A (cyclophilin A)